MSPILYITHFFLRINRPASFSCLLSYQVPLFQVFQCPRSSPDLHIICTLPQALCRHAAHLKRQQMYRNDCEEMKTHDNSLNRKPVTKTVDETAMRAHLKAPLPGKHVHTQSSFPHRFLSTLMNIALGNGIETLASL